jgi:hypothetical protein
MAIRFASCWVCPLRTVHMPPPFGLASLRKGDAASYVRCIAGLKTRLHAASCAARSACWGWASRPGIGPGSTVGRLHTLALLICGQEREPCKVGARALQGGSASPAKWEREPCKGNNLTRSPRAGQAAFHVFGMELLASLDLAATNQFFRTFFRLPDPLWRGFLSSTLGSGRLVVFALATFLLAPPGIKLALMRHLVTNPAGAYLIRHYLGARARPAQGLGLGRGVGRVGAV